MGVLKALYSKIKQEDIKNGIDDKPMFDIIIGTSMGAVNAAILVSHITQNSKTWEGSIEELYNFWKYISATSYAERAGFTDFWNFLRSINSNIVSTEDARRYYSVKEFLVSGVPKVFSPPKAVFNYELLDPTYGEFQYDLSPLANSISQFAKFPIATSYDKGEPRLLLLSTDIQNSTAVVFDSYVKEDGSRRSEYGDQEERIVIKYDNGIGLEHVMASTSPPGSFNYVNLKAECLKNNIYNYVDRHFWDSRWSSTPLRELNPGP